MVNVMLAAWGPPSVARRAGHDWKTLPKDQRRLVSDVTRFLHGQHVALMAELEARIFDQSAPGEQDYELARALAGLPDFDHPDMRAERIVWLTAARNTIARLRDRGLDVQNVRSDKGFV